MEDSDFALCLILLFVCFFLGCLFGSSVSKNQLAKDIANGNKTVEKHVWPDGTVDIKIVRTEDTVRVNNSN